MVQSLHSIHCRQPTMVSKISEFNILLNDLSSELYQANLRSLMHVCRELIPGGQRETIRSGLDVFSILLHRNVIGEDPPKMAFLLGIIKELRPRRRDLVSMVKRHIKQNYEAPEEILDDVDSSSDGYAISRSPTPVVMDHNECCAARCCCLNCVCIPCCSAFSCCLFLTVSFIFLVVMASVFWYTRHFPSVYNYLHSKDDLKDAGPVVIGILAFFTICSVLSVIYTSVKKGRNNISYSKLASINDARSTEVVPGSRYAASDSTRTSYSGYVKKIDRPSRRRDYSCSSGGITRSNSLGTPPPLTYANDATYSGSQQDVSSTEIKAEEGGKEGEN